MASCAGCLTSVDLYPQRVRNAFSFSQFDFKKKDVINGRKFTTEENLVRKRFISKNFSVEISRFLQNLKNRTAVTSLPKKKKKK